MAMATTLTRPRQLSQEEVDFYNEHGFLRLQGVFSKSEIEELSAELDYVIENFATRGKGWSGPWRQQLMDPREEQQSVLVALHEIECYAASWLRAIVKPRLVQSLADILGPTVEFHHATLHAKGPDFGAPFPMHQDYPFYPHQDGRYIDAILHVDGADEDSGCLKFLDGSHKLGPLEHRMEGSPHLDQTVYRLEDAVSCPAEPGDVVFFSINTIHGSSLNRRPRWRRVMRLGYRDPHNRQLSGQGFGRPGLMVYGVRPKLGEEKLDVYGDPKLNAALQEGQAGRPAGATPPAPQPAPAKNGETGETGESIAVAGVERVNPYGNWGPKAQPILDDD
ncbi:MAG TPA: phytanoyl-CoA dioxygenase family protein [Chloroflexota bacterium]|jgi:phytanoyl-CoA hydroxylase|nr:phytanoyl-CoA dioxygenase family protein [Chloroflexota bacterium]